MPRLTTNYNELLTQITVVSQPFYFKFIIIVDALLNNGFYCRDLPPLQVKNTRNVSRNTIAVDICNHFRYDHSGGQIYILPISTDNSSSVVTAKGLGCLISEKIV